MNLKEMLSFFSSVKELKTIWKVERDGKGGYLAGTAHFFPYSLKKSLLHYIRKAKVVLFEGPLDEQSMNQVIENGSQAGGATALIEALDAQTIEKIKKSTGSLFRESDSFPLILPFAAKVQNHLHAHFQNLRPWMAFFHIWSNFLKERGWKHSVDLEAFNIATSLRKEIIFLETIEEQIAGMEGIPLERFTNFFKKIDQWEAWAKSHARLYLQGDIEAIMAVISEFPSRCPSIVENRDPVMFARMKGFFEKGQVIAFVGTSHIPGIKKRFLEAGYKVTRHYGG